jgi:hypothetical protein
MDSDAMIAAELAGLPEPRPGYRGGWWFDGTKHSSRWRADAARLALATQRVELRQAENARNDREQAAYFARGMSPATTRALQPGDVYSIPARRPPFTYREYVVAGEPERLASGATLVRHTRQTDDPDEQDCLLHTSDLFLYRRPAGA